jgi:hypothetical protein
MLASRGSLAQRAGEILEYLFGNKPACRGTNDGAKAGIRLDNTADTGPNMVTDTTAVVDSMRKATLFPQTIAAACVSGQIKLL